MKKLGFIIFAFIAATAVTQATTYEWTFNAGNLSDAFGNGVMAAKGTTTPVFANTNGGSLPHIGGVAAKVLQVPAFSSAADGFSLSLNGTMANGGGAYINQYTFVLDVYSPGAPAYQALLQTNPDNTDGNDADWYIHPEGKHGLGNNYTPPGSVPQDSWHRLVFTADLGAGRLTYYVDGVQGAQQLGPPELDGRFSLYSAADPGDDVRLFNEGDTSGIYTHDMYVNSIAFVDRELTGQEVAGLGGPRAAGILVPEPGSTALLMIGLSVLARTRGRRRSA